MVRIPDEDRVKDTVQTPDENGEYSCPVCGKYTGEQGSVEAHITGKSDPDHKGKVGKDYRVEDSDGNVHLRTENGPPKAGTSQINELLEDPEPVQDDLPDDDPDSDKSSGLATGVLIGLLIVVWWIARRTGNEDQVRNQFPDQP